jgi:uncharacterized protein YjbJ (UPF0337 family)
MKNKIKGTVTELKGKATGSKRTELKGKLQKAAGSLEQGIKSVAYDAEHAKKTRA